MRYVWVNANVLVMCFISKRAGNLSGWDYILINKILLWRESN